MKRVLASAISLAVGTGFSPTVELVRKGALLGPAQGVPMRVRGKRPDFQRVGI